MRYFGHYLVYLVGVTALWSAEVPVEISLVDQAIQGNIVSIINAGYGETLSHQEEDQLFEILRENREISHDIKIAAMTTLVRRGTRIERIVECMVQSLDSEVQNYAVTCLGRLGHAGVLALTELSPDLTGDPSLAVGILKALWSSGDISAVVSETALSLLGRHNENANVQLWGRRLLYHFPDGNRGGMSRNDIREYILLAVSRSQPNDEALNALAAVLDAPTVTEILKNGAQLGPGLSNHELALRACVSNRVDDMSLLYSQLMVNEDVPLKVRGMSLALISSSAVIPTSTDSVISQWLDSTSAHQEYALASILRGFKLTPDLRSKVLATDWSSPQAAHLAQRVRALDSFSE